MIRLDKRAGLAIALFLLAVLGVWLYLRLPPTSLVGAWSNQAPTNRIGFTFREDGSGMMTIGDARLDYRYRFDRAHQPPWLDLHAAPNGAPVTIKAIAEFPSNNRLKIRLPFTRTPGERPQGFPADDVENTILLTRVESNP